jgi:SDR family mycofactocin-dependent oxidoreductase
MSDLEGRTALVTGGARGQGRAEAIALARRGCNVVLFDVCGPLDTVSYDMPDASDLEHTAALVAEAGAQALTVTGDVRSIADQRRAADAGRERFGSLDFLVANAGIWSYAGRTHEIPEDVWDEMVDINLKGVWNSFRAVVPHMLEAGFGRIVATASIVVRGGFGYQAHYNAAKAGVSLLVKTAALEYAEQGITVNAVLPTNVNTPMIRNPLMYRLMAGGGYSSTSGGAVEGEATVEDALPGYGSIMALPIPWVEPEDIAAAVVYLLDESGRSITGVELPVNGGFNRAM